MSAPRTAWWLTADRRRSLAILAAGAFVWEMVARLGGVSAIFFPPPTTIFASLWRDLLSGALHPHVAATLMRAIPALVLGGVPAFLLGFGMGWSPRLRHVAEPFVSALHPVPKLALLPLFMVMAGIGEGAKVLAVAAAAFFPLLVSVVAGVRQIPPMHLEVARNYGATGTRLVRRVLIPAALPSVMTGLRLAANLALVTTIGVEMIAADVGLGTRVWLSWQVMRTDQLYATLFVIALIGVVLTLTLRWCERRLMPWRPPDPDAPATIVEAR